MQRIFTGLFLAVAAAMPACAQGTSYTLDAANSHIGFSIRHFVIDTTDGKFSQFDGKLSLPPQGPERGAVTIHIAPASIDTGIGLRDDHLRGADFFDVTKFPVATFQSTGVTRRGGRAGRLTGLMTLHGVTRPVTLDVTLKSPDMNGDRLDFTASGTMKRSDFGMDSYTGVIGDEVTLTIDAQFDRAP